MPDGSENVYWHVEGAVSIDGHQAATFPEGSLIAQEHPTLAIQWIAKLDPDSIHALQLRRFNLETKQVEVLADMALARLSSASNKIHFHGQVPDVTTNYRADPLDVCPNPVDFGTRSQGYVSGEAYQFEMESTNCTGNNGSTTCRYRPSFIWTVKFYTAAGTYYVQQWQDLTANDYSKIRLYLYNRVPYPGITRTSAQETQAGGNNNFSALPATALCASLTSSTANPGDLIDHVQLECSAYGCGFFGITPDRDEIEIRYNGLAPQPITVQNNPTAPLCRNTTYQLQTNGAQNASGYRWTASNGATTTQAPGYGNVVTLNLSQVPASATSVTVNVLALNTLCGGASSTATSITLNLEPGLPALQNLQLSNGTCATVGPNDVKALTVDAPIGSVPGTIVSYEWKLLNSSGTGPATNATFFPGGGTTTTSYAATALIRTPASEQFIATVSARIASDCGYLTAPQAQPFTITSSTPVCPTNADFLQGFCVNLSNLMTLRNPEPGATYTISVNNVLPSSAAIDFRQTISGGQFQPSGSVRITSNTLPTSFDVNVAVVAACPPISVLPCPPFRVTLGPQYVSCVTGPRSSGPTPPTLFPNPTSGQVEIQAGGAARYAWVKVTDSQGRTLLEQKASDEAGVKAFTLQAFPAGLYQVQLFDGKQLSTQRLVKE